MRHPQIIRALSALGEIFQQWTLENPSFMEEARLKNPWFTTDNQLYAMQQWSIALQSTSVSSWLNKYDIPEKRSSKTIALIMAGNIPFVGLHDLLCILASGHTALVKLSKDDEVLMKQVIHALISIEPTWKNQIRIESDWMQKGSFDAVIATGSNNSNRYFEAYFSKFPSLLRKHRNSVAVIQGHETEAQMAALGVDIFRYFGMGCRNVSKLFLPEGFDVSRFFEPLHAWKDIIHHNGYANNYQYHKAIWLMDQEPFLDNGYVMLKENNSMSSPLSCMYVTYYNRVEDVFTYLQQTSDSIQCIVSDRDGDIAFGQTQSPALHEYADHIDTMEFLLK